MQQLHAWLVAAQELLDQLSAVLVSGVRDRHKPGFSAGSSSAGTAQFGGLQAAQSTPQLMAGSQAFLQAARLFVS